MEANDKLSLNLFHLKWYEKSKKFKTAMTILMQNARNPMKISAFGVFRLNMRTFLRIVHSTYSLYAVLKNFEREN